MKGMLLHTDSHGADVALTAELKTVAIMLVLLAGLLGSLVAEAGDDLRGTGDLAVVIERAGGKVLIVDTTVNQSIAEVAGLGDLSHASVVLFA